MRHYWCSIILSSFPSVPEFHRVVPCCKHVLQPKLYTIMLVFSSPALTNTLLLCFLLSWDGKKDAPTHPAFFFRWGLANFCPDKPQTLILPISVSQAAGITGLSHCTWASEMF
jgi:hypothetical protein